jgi:cyclic pyranopterin phosphate synthase
MRGFNEDQIIPFGMFAREEGVVVRFIEFMPLEEDRVWSPNTVVPLEEIVRRMGEYRPLVEIPHARSETARRYRFDDGIGEIGIIAPVTASADTVAASASPTARFARLLSIWDHDLHGQMRRGASMKNLAEFIRGVIQKRRAPPYPGEPDFKSLHRPWSISG